ncbi:hypothetical protein G6011_04976 [Alternaria panax]|uniref:Uncharacterized protein n=1 Tax=Alternaria panax TaxID=48097 RepID=A0AAD4FBX9_9PLEO|nr:hypothetical protein G6011_04976 [Alternaria panax]
MTKSTTSVKIDPDRALNHQLRTTPYLFTKTSIFPFLFLFVSILIVDHFTHRRRLQMSMTQQEEQELAETWDQPWLTKDWSTLYGLIALAHENDIEPQHTPFRTEYISTIQARLKRPPRWALRRLLERGIIPLRINDGGVSTTCTQTWGLAPTFPYMTISLYQQTKSRASLEFLIPHPEQTGVAHLINMLGRNRMSYGISTRTHSPLSQKSQTATASNVRNQPRSGPGFPLSLGAQSTCEVLLPFLPDRHVVHGQGTRIDRLDAYLKSGPDTEARQDGRPRPDLQMARVPLLHYSSWIIVRVEAPHWGYVELDNWVLGAVEESGMEDRWMRSVCQGHAVEELGQCGLEI